MKKINDKPDIRDDRIGGMLRAVLDGQMTTRSSIQTAERITEKEFAHVYRYAEADEHKRKKTAAALRIIPSVLAACLVLMLAPKGNSAAALSDFRSAVTVLSRESVMDDTWTAGSLRGARAAEEDENISSFVQNLWNQDDIGYD